MVWAPSSGGISPGGLETDFSLFPWIVTNEDDVFGLWEWVLTQCILTVTV